MLLIPLLFILGCLSDDKKPPPLPATTISGSAFFGKKVSGGTVAVFSYGNGSKGNLLGTASVDSNGNYSLSVSVPTGALLFEVQGLRVQELFSNKTTSMVETQVFRQYGWLEAGTDMVANITPFTILAAGLSDYYSSSGISVQEAILQSKEEVKKWVQIESATTSWIEVSDPKNNFADIGDPIRHGLLTASLSLQTYLLSLEIWGSNFEHEYINSIIYTDIITRDIRADGILNGFVDSGQLKLGSRIIDQDFYQRDLATAILLLYRDDRNQLQLQPHVVRQFVEMVNTNNPIFFTGTVSQIEEFDFAILNLDTYAAKTISNTYTLSWHIISFLPVANTSFSISPAAQDSYTVLQSGEQTSFAFNTIPYADGAYTIRITATDNSDYHIEETVTININNSGTTVDNFNPHENSIITSMEELLFTLNPGIGYMIDSVTVSAVINDIMFQHTCSQTAVVRQYHCLFNFPDIPDGPLALSLQITNNADPPQTHHVPVMYQVDNTMPSIQWNNIGEQQYINATHTNASVVVADNNLSSASVAIADELTQLDPALGSATWNFTIAEYPDGPKTITIMATDQAGNAHTDSRMVTIDTVLPQLTVAAIDEHYASSITLSGTVSDETFDRISVFLSSASLDEDINLGNATVFHTASNINWSFVFDPSAVVAGAPVYPDGNYQFIIKATDQANNTYTTSAEPLSFVLDTTYPIISYTQAIPASFCSLNISGSIEDVSTASLDFYLANNLIGAATINQSNWSFTWDYEGNSYGNTVFTTTATDAVNNSTTTTVSVAHDCAPPTFAPITYPAVAGAGTAITIQSEATDPNPSGGIYSTSLWHQETALVTNNDINSTATLINFSVPDISELSGATTFTIKATDHAGNSHSESISIYIDTFAPTQLGTATWRKNTHTTTTYYECGVNCYADYSNTSAPTFNLSFQIQDHSAVTIAGCTLTSQNEDNPPLHTYTCSSKTNPWPGGTCPATYSVADTYGNAGTIEPTCTTTTSSSDNYQY